MTNSDSTILTQLQQASSSLLWMSESESPFEVLLWQAPDNQTLTPAQVLQLTGHPEDAPIEEVGLDDFFALATTEQDWHGDEEKEMVKKYQNLVATLRNTLKDVQVFRVGKRNLDIYIVGKTSSGNWAGLSTKAVET